MPNLADWLSSAGPTGARAMMHAMRLAAERAERGAKGRGEADPKLVTLFLPGTGRCFGYRIGNDCGPLVDADGHIPLEGGAERARMALAEKMGVVA